jgi:hypothetical protein
MSSSKSTSKSPRAQLTPPNLLSMLHPPHPPNLLSMLHHPPQPDPKSRSFDDPLPRRIYNNPYPYPDTLPMPQQRPISPQVSLSPSQAAKYLINWREQHNITQPEPAELPRRFTTIFRKLMKIENGKVTLTLNDATRINMGVANIAHAVSKINPIPNPTTGPITGSFYSIVTPDSNHPLIAHMSPTGIIVLYTPPPPARSPPPPPPHRNGGTMGRKGTNKRRRRHISKTRHRHRRRCMNHTRRK